MQRDERGVDLLADERAYVPFAVIGIFLLLTSVAVIAVLETRSDPEIDTDPAQAYDRTSAATQTALQQATTSALQDAAARPVTDANASTAVGSAIAGSDANETFTRYVKLRVYLAAQDRLEHTGQTLRGDTVTNVSVPHHDDPADAVDAVTLHVGGEDLDYGDPGGADLPHGAVRVSVPDVRIVVREDGQIVAERTQDYTVTVGSSVFELHDRTNRYEQSLNAEFGAGTGFARHLSARLTRLAWQRGHAQASGGPVAEVLTSRHVETLANDALFATQRDVFGNDDPYSDRTLTRAYACTLAADHHGVYDDPTGGTDDLDAVLDRVDDPGFCDGNATVYDDVPGSLHDADAPDYTEVAGENDFLERTSTVDLDEVSETVVGDLETGGVVSDVIDRLYTVEVTVEDDLTERQIPAADEVEAPGSGWEVDDTSVQSVDSYRVHRVEGERVLADSTDSRREYYRYNVTYSADVAREITWRNGGDTQSTTGSAVLLVDGTLTVTGEHSPDARVDDLGLENDYEPGPLGSGDLPFDTNYEGVPADAVEAVFPGVDDVEEGEEQLAAALADNAEQIRSDDDLVRRLTVGGASTRVHPEPDDRAALHGWLVRDLDDLESQTAGVSVTAPHHEFLENESRLEALTDQMREDHWVYGPVDGSHYANVPAAVRSEVRLEYVDRLRDRVNATIRQHGRERDRLDAAIRSHTGASLQNATTYAREDLDGDPYAPSPELEDNALLETAALVPDGEPTFVTFDRIDAEQVPAAGSPPHGFAPVAGRADNVYGAPATDVTPDADEVHLRTAGEVLEAANATDDVADDPSWDRGDTSRLESSLAADVDARVRDAARAAAEPFDHISAAEMRAAIRRELDAQGPLETQAIALSRGTDRVDEVAENVARSFDRPDDPQYGYYGTDYFVHLETSVRYGLRAAVGDGLVRGGTARLTTDLQSHVRDELEAENDVAIDERLQQASDDGLANESETETTGTWFSGTADDPAPNRVSSGAVTLDRPAMNVLTENLWNVHLRGAYPRFVASASPDRVQSSGRVEYVREARTVELAYDGSEQTAGDVQPLTFDANASVVVAVPAESFGVGSRTAATTWCSESYDVAGPVHDPSRFASCDSP